MSILQTIILGIVEGITEFLPVSSTFHIIFASLFLGIEPDTFTKLFDVVIQSGAILAVLFLYFGNLRKDPSLIKKTLVAFIPTAVLGFIFYKTIKQNFFEAYSYIFYVFVLVGFVFLYFEKQVKKGKINPEKEIDELTYRDAALIGLFQSLAFVPGVSRAGAVILTMMFLGFRRADSAYFSFILSIPTIFSAGLYDLYKNPGALAIGNGNLVSLLIGFFVAFVSAYFVVRWFIQYLQNHTLKLFGYYRIAAGLLLLLGLIMFY
jgi:undecaprenyl-diphosphatase